MNFSKTLNLSMESMNEFQRRVSFVVLTTGWPKSRFEYNCYFIIGLYDQRKFGSLIVYIKSYEVCPALMNISNKVVIYKMKLYLLKFGRICSIVHFDVFVKMKATCFGHRLSCKVHQGENDKNRKELHITWVLIFVVLLFTPMYS